MKWNYPTLSELPEEFSSLVGGHPIIAQTLWQRGIQKPQQVRAFFDPAYYSPSSPFDLQDMLPAVELMDRAIESNEAIVVWGDFDVDGQTSTALLVSALSQLGANVSYHIPIRGMESHGINRIELEKIIREGAKLLITCDTGISEHENVCFAVENNLTVIITDHHQLEDTLPQANAVINPNRLSPNHPSATLPGVGVAYKFVEALYSFRNVDVPLEQFLDLVALGIVVDVAEIKHDTRYFLQKGLKVLQNSKRLGLQVLCNKAEVDLTSIDEEIIGFQIGPRMNAVGRLEDANSVVELLLTNDKDRAEFISTNIEGLNIRRKLLVRQVQDAAIKMVDQDADLRHSKALILHHPDWPPGIIGIVASHLVNRFHKPVILLTGMDERIRGSARSIEGLNILEAIKSQEQFLSNAGGHPMAAGLSLPIENLAAFRYGFNKFIEGKFEQGDLIPTLDIASIIDFSEISIPFIEDIQRLSPFGRGNPKLNFLFKGVKVTTSQIIGRDQDHRQLIICNDAGFRLKAVWWNGGHEEPPIGKFDLAANLSISTFQEQKEITLSWIDTNFSDELIVLKESKQLFDHRQNRYPEEILKSILVEAPTTLIWAENLLPINIDVVDRFNLSKCDSLVLWNIPPSQKILSTLLSKTEAKCIHIFANQGSTESKKDFLISLMGLLKYSLKNHGGIFKIDQLVVATVQTEEMVNLGLKWLLDKGVFALQQVDSDTYAVKVGSQIESEYFKQTSTYFQSQWDEFISFQRFYQNTNINDLLND